MQIKWCKRDFKTKMHKTSAECISTVKHKLNRCRML